jgi:hypothetical protein
MDTVRSYKDVSNLVDDPDEEVEEAESESFLPDLGVQPPLPMGAPTIELVEVAQDGYSSNTDSGDAQKD